MHIVQIEHKRKKTSVILNVSRIHVPFETIPFANLLNPGNGEHKALLTE